MANIYAFKKANLPVFYLVGGPGSGKATQASKLKQKFGYTVLNMGKLLRDEVKTGSCRSNKIREALQTGDIAPQNVTLDILKEYLVKSVCAGKPVLIVGFPRNACQRKAFEKEICEPKAIIYLEVSECTMRKRQQYRSGCNDRSDVIGRRVNVFQQQTKPMIDDMINGGRVMKIDGELSCEQVFCALSKAMECQNSQMFSTNTENLDSSVLTILPDPSTAGGGCSCGGNCSPQSSPCQPQPSPCNKNQLPCSKPLPCGEPPVHRCGE